MTAPPLPGVLADLAPVLEGWGYAAVGGLIFLEDFGVPVPGETVLIAAAVYAGAGRLNVFAVAVIAVVAAVAGDNIGYAIGRYGGRRLVARFGRYVLLTPERVAKAEEFFTRHGGKVITVARFIEGLRQANGIIAGLSGMPWRRFLAFNALGAVLWVGTWVTLGALAGNHIDTLYPAVQRYGLYPTAAAVVVLIVLVARRRLRRRTPSASPPSPAPDDRDDRDDQDGQGDR
ncbi:DedA family protein [Streptomyces sp. NPDC052051]|uniref:DedA family protein n=1 Tax=Streptomyces sp. NPDC052051 TaxID=3154649 RepID=UPI0034144E49